MHPAEMRSEELLKECEVERTRRSGPGGQHRNKVESAIVVRHPGTGIKVEASERRSQHENLKIAAWRMRLALAIGFRTVRRGMSVSELWRRRSAGGRIVVSGEHEDLPALLAEGMDVLAEEEWDARRAGERLGCSASQILKFVRQTPMAWQSLNQKRKEGGLRAYV